MKIIQCDQGTEEWFACRRGKPSASNFDKLITTKGEPSKQAEKYMFKLAGESVSGISEETYQSAAMERGVILEEEARKFYELVKGVSVEQAGFCLTDDEISGCSPDGLVGECGLIEIKCPSVAVHVSYLISNCLPTDYFQQVQGQLYVTGRKWCDFISYFPGLRPLIIRVEPDDQFQKCLDIEIKLFNEKLQETIKKIGG